MSKAPVDAVQTSIQLLDELEASAPASVTTLAERLDRPKATVYYHLKTLEESGYVVGTADGYELGLRLLALGSRARQQRDLPAKVEPSLKQLATESNEMTVFALQERQSAVIVGVEGPAGVDTPVDVTAGTHLPLHCSAVGKALLAELPEHQLSAALETTDFTQHTSETIGTESSLREQLKSVRENRHAFDRGEWKDDVRSVASPVLDADGSVIGAIGIVGPSSRLYSDRFTHELPHLVQRFAERVEHALRS